VLRVAKKDYPAVLVVMIGMPETPPIGVGVPQTGPIGPDPAALLLLIVGAHEEPRSRRNCECCDSILLRLSADACQGAANALAIIQSPRPGPLPQERYVADTASVLVAADDGVGIFPERGPLGADVAAANVKVRGGHAEEGKLSIAEPIPPKPCIRVLRVAKKDYPAVLVVMIGMPETPPIGVGVPQTGPIGPDPAALLLLIVGAHEEPRSRRNCECCDSILLRLSTDAR